MQIIEQQRPPARRGNPSVRISAHPYRLLHMTEELIRGELWRHGANAERVESAGPPAQLMDVFGEEGFSRPLSHAESRVSPRAQRHAPGDRVDHRRSQGDGLVRRRPRTAIGSR